MKMKLKNPLTQLENVKGSLTIRVKQTKIKERI